MGEPKQTLIIIPDISGFTTFVNEVAITHSEHIVRELLEIIIDSNNVGLEVSEVEGDAVLFYKSEELPKPIDIHRMVEQMFIRFHEHLLLYKSNRLCQCGACQTAHNLNLKVVIDQGYLKPINIRSHRKLIGPALVGAHRLLKNDIPSDEYLLLSERYVNFQECLQLSEHFDWIQWQKGCNEYEDFGEVNYHFALLSPLKKRLKSPGDRKKDFFVKHPPVLRQSINVDFRKVYQVIINSEQKTHWVKGINKVIKARNDEIDRIGSKHVCVINGAEMEFEAVEGGEQKDRLEYMEVMQKIGPFEHIAFNYKVISKTRSTSIVELEIHYQTRGLLKPLKAIALQMIKWQMTASLKNLKRYLENFNNSKQKTGNVQQSKEY